MPAIIGALFLLGMAITMLISIQGCDTVSLFLTLLYGSVWALVPSLVFILTNNKYMTLLSIWIPTLILIGMVDATICPDKTQTPASK